MKMKKLLWVVLFSFMAVTCMATASYAADVKVGYVDLSRLFDEYHQTKSFDKTLEEKHNKFVEERNEKIEKIQEEQGKLSLLKENEKAKVEEKIEKLKADLLEFDRQQKEDLAKERNEKIREILLEIEKVVSNYAEKDNYSLIFNDRVLIFGNEGFDLTEDILKILNEEKK